MKISEIFSHSTSALLAGVALSAAITNAEPVDLPAEKPVQNPVIFYADNDINLSLISASFGLDLVNPAYLVYQDETNGFKGQAGFCERLSSECAGRYTNTNVVVADDAFMERLREMNMTTNLMVRGINDADYYPEIDYWTIAVNAGDCEDYVLAKRATLRSWGVPENAMSLAYVTIPEDMAPKGSVLDHAVLVLRTNTGDWILDNVRNSVLLPYQTRYEFHSATSFENFTEWKTLAKVEYNPSFLPIQVVSTEDLVTITSDPLLDADADALAVTSESKSEFRLPAEAPIPPLKPIMP